MTSPSPSIDPAKTGVEEVAGQGGVKLPRVAITFCTQCRWMLRAAYFAQELLSTFGTQIGEVALIPATGGVFRVELTHVPPSPTSTSTTASTTTLLWDRKAESGFPETKVLKQRLRDQIDPARDLGHSDVGGKKSKSKETESKNENEKKGDGVGETGPGTQGAKEGAEEAREEQEGKESVKDVRVDGKAERAAEEMVRDMQAEDVPEKTDVAEETDTSGGVKLNEDGSVCEDCR